MSTPKFPRPWRLKQTSSGALKIEDAAGRTILTSNWAMVQNLSKEEYDDLYDQVKGMVLAGNSKQKQVEKMIKDIEDNPLPTML